MTIRDAIGLAREKLSDLYDSNEAAAIILRLVEHFFCISKNAYYLSHEQVVSPADAEQFINALSKLQQSMPVQYVVGATEFYGMPFAVNENVLIPRPETEELVEWVYNDYKGKPARILDIGTGSGCIAVSLAKLLPSAHVVATDISGSALKVAQQNARQNAVSVSFVESDILANHSMPSQAAFDVIVSNPPYVRNAEKALMRSNVLDFEPHSALFVEDNDPLIFYRAIIQHASALLVSGGSIYFEVNEALGRETTELFSATEYALVELRKDMNGKDRMVKAIKK